VAGDGYTDEHLMQEPLVYTRNVIASSRQHRFILAEVIGDHTFLPLIISILGGDRDTVRILDFGGGMGDDNMHLVKGVVHAMDIDYHIVGNRSMCESGSRLFEKDSRIHIYPSFPKSLCKVVIVLVCSASQYDENYSDLLKALSNYHADDFLSVKHLAGDIAAYATAQRDLSGTIASYWFINVGEIESLMSAYDHMLISRELSRRVSAETSM
jgi:putative methyltransferase (TIGR04325 family)